jgi:hypothetical protein
MDLNGRPCPLNAKKGDPYALVLELKATPLPLNWN